MFILFLFLDTCLPTQTTPIENINQNKIKVSAKRNPLIFSFDFWFHCKFCWTVGNPLRNWLVRLADRFDYCWVFFFFLKPFLNFKWTEKKKKLKLFGFSRRTFILKKRHVEFFRPSFPKNIKIAGKSTKIISDPRKKNKKLFIITCFFFSFHFHCVRLNKLHSLF